ncbi:hypothetical protein DYD21_18940 [Rhodohalobacter sp. SW132]|nr:hypothetical protein DYD21_18940 [Rhodohalobacter sp. SW132]
MHRKSSGIKNTFIEDSSKAKQCEAFLRRTVLTEQETFKNVMHDLKVYFSKGLDLPIHESNN